MMDDTITSYDPFTGEQKYGTSSAYIPGRLGPVTLTKSDGTTEQVDLRPTQDFQQQMNARLQNQYNNNQMQQGYYQQQNPQMMYQNQQMQNPYCQNMNYQQQMYNNQMQQMNYNRNSYFSNNGGYNPVNNSMVPGFDPNNPYLQSNQSGYDPSMFQNSYELMMLARDANPAGAGFNMFGGMSNNWYYQNEINNIIYSDECINNGQLRADLNRIMFTDEAKQRMMNERGSMYGGGYFDNGSNYYGNYYGYASWYDWFTEYRQQLQADHDNQVNVMVALERTAAYGLGKEFDEDAARLKWDPQLQYAKRMQEEVEYQKKKEEEAHFRTPKHILDKVTQNGFMIASIENQYSMMQPLLAEQKRYFYNKVKEHHDEMLGIKPGQRGSILDYFNNAANLNKESIFANAAFNKNKNLSKEEQLKMSCIHGDISRFHFDNLNTIEDDYLSRNTAWRENGLDNMFDSDSNGCSNDSKLRSRGGLNIKTTYDENGKPHRTIDIKRQCIGDDVDEVDDECYDEAMDEFLKEIGGRSPEKIVMDDGQIIYRISPIGDNFVNTERNNKADPDYIGYHATAIKHAKKFMHKKASQNSIDSKGKNMHEVLSDANREISRRFNENK